MNHKITLDIDQLSQPHWTQKDKTNASTVLGFIEELMNKHSFDTLAKRQGNTPYKQHNQNMADGLDAVIDFVKGYVKIFPDYCYDVKHMYVDGPYVTVHSHATLRKKHRGNPKKGFNIIDTWKVENGQLVEHWDAVQPINSFMRFFMWLVGGGFKNSNTYF